MYKWTDPNSYDPCKVWVQTETNSQKSIKYKSKI